MQKLKLSFLFLKQQTKMSNVENENLNDQNAQQENQIYLQPRITLSCPTTPQVANMEEDEDPD